jgi:glycosyltransferase involved in cell wall biosynthesis
VKVGVVTTSYPRFAGDAAGGFVAEHVRSLQAIGHSVDVIAAGDDNDAPGITRVRAAPGLFYSGGAPDALEAGAASARDALAFTARLAAAVRRRAPAWDGVVAHWLAPSALAALSTRGPLLAIAHGGDVHLLARARLLAPALAALAARRAKLVFVTAALRDLARAAVPPSLARWIDRHAIVQAMGVDLARFAAIPAAPAASRPTIAVLARLVPIKGVDVAIDAMAALAAPVRLVIAGAGPAAAPLAERAARVAARTGHAIELAGALDAERRDRLLATAALVVVPSREMPARSEGAPVTAIEALAAGRPVVACATGGLADLPPPVRLVAPDDPAALARTIAAVLAAPPAPDLCRAAAAPRAWSIVATRLHDHWLAAQPATHHARN